MRPHKLLRLIVHLEDHSHEAFGDLDRLQVNATYQEVLAVPIRKVTIPVAAGRNLAVLVEAAVRNFVLNQRGIDNIVLTGITTDVCVHTTMREANDRGFECVMLEDCCGATDYGNHLAAVKMIKMQGGVFGAVSNSATLVEQLP